MPWSNLASNQMVSFTDAQTSGIVLKPGQSQVTSNQCMTKAEIIAKYYVTISGYSDNQLVPKSAWNGNVFIFVIGPSYASGPAACVFNEPTKRTRYTNTRNLVVGTVVYTDTALTLPLNGGGSWFQGFNDASGRSYQINSSGQITAIYDCMY